MLRGLAHHLMHSPGDVSSFRAWWTKRIGQNIRTRPESFDSASSAAMHNMHEVIAGIRNALDNTEADVVEAYIKQASRLAVNPRWMRRIMDRAD